MRDYGTHIFGNFCSVVALSRAYSEKLILS